VKYIFAIYDYAFWLIYSFIVDFIRINPTPRKNAIALVSLLPMLNISWCTYFALSHVYGSQWLYMLAPMQNLLIIFIPLMAFFIVFNLRYTPSRCEMLCERYSSNSFFVKCVISIFVIAYVFASIYLLLGKVGFNHMR